MNENTINILHRVGPPEITTSMLMGLLSNYKSPRKKIHDLTRLGWLLPVRQGVYLISDKLGMRPYSNYRLANLMYGPSYISLETALSYYRFIPENIVTTTSVCLGRRKLFSTPVGDYEYNHVDRDIYAEGVVLVSQDEKYNCLFATPEKALTDFIYLREKRGEFKNASEYFEYIMQSYRLDLIEIKKTISPKKIASLAKLYSPHRVRWFVDCLTQEFLK